MIETRHTRSPENRLPYAHLDHLDDPEAEISVADSPEGTGDDEAARYETDLIALADHAGAPRPTDYVTDPGPMPDTVDPVPEAELAGFAALLSHHRTDPAVEDPLAGITPGDTDTDDFLAGQTSAPRQESLSRGSTERRSWRARPDRGPGLAIEEIRRSHPVVMPKGCFLP